MKLTRLREVRELHGWSQSKLAEESGVSRDGISNYETGQREAWPATAKKIADALGVEIADLVARVEELAGAGKGEAPREAGPGETREPDDEDRSVRDIARSEARQQFEKSIKALRRTAASEGLDRATQISDPYDLGVYNALKRRDPGDLAGGLLDAEQDILWQAHRIKELEQENAQLRQQPARQQEEAREETQRA